MTEGEEYRDGEFEYGLIETMLDEIVDNYNLRVFMYMESDKYDNAESTAIIPDAETEADFADLRMNALVCLVSDILRSRAKEDRASVIAEIYDTVYEGIHFDDEPENGNEEDGDIELE